MLKDADFWMKSAQAELASKLKDESRIESLAKNTIFFLGDGMSLPSLAAARIYKGQHLDNLPFGEEAELAFEKFPHVGISKVITIFLKISQTFKTLLLSFLTFNFPFTITNSLYFEKFSNDPFSPALPHFYLNHKPTQQNNYSTNEFDIVLQITISVLI